MLEMEVDTGEGWLIRRMVRSLVKVGCRSWGVSLDLVGQGIEGWEMWVT